jgi:hypothetical protein
MSELETARPAKGNRLSVLGSLKERREQIVEESYIDLPVPRWHDPEVVVRYKPVPHTVVRKAMNNNVPDKRKGNAEVEANCEVLIYGCVGVFARLDGHEYSMRPGDENGTWTTFDEDLAENLGCNPSAIEVVRKLYITDGDILSAASKVGEFSGYREQYADEEALGE